MFSIFGFVEIRVGLVTKSKLAICQVIFFWLCPGLKKTSGFWPTFAFVQFLNLKKGGPFPSGLSFLIYCHLFEYKQLLKNFLHSAGIELRSAEQISKTLTTIPPPRPQTLIAISNTEDSLNGASYEIPIGHCRT